MAAAAERIFAFLERARGEPRDAHRRGSAGRWIRPTWSSTTCASATRPDKPVIRRLLRQGGSRARPWPSWAPPARARPPWSSCSCASTTWTRAPSASDGTRHPRALPAPTCANLFGMVLQDTWLFNGTVRDNIRYGRAGRHRRGGGGGRARRRCAAPFHHARCAARLRHRDQRGRQQHQRRASGSCSPSPVPSWPTGACSSWTRPPQAWTRAPRSASRGPWTI